MNTYLHHFRGKNVSPEEESIFLKVEINNLKESIARMENSRSLRWTRFFRRIFMKKTGQAPAPKPKKLSEKELEYFIVNRQTRILTIIPTNGKNLSQLEKCLTALNRASKGIFMRTMIVVCPGTEIDEKNIRPLLHRDEELLLLPGPFSFARSNNAALRQIKNERCVLFLNDDCFFRGETDVRVLTETLFKGAYACVGPWIEHQNNSFELTPGLPTNGIVHITEPLVGACVLWNRDWLQKIGFFYDETFDGYGGEESDLSIRVLYAGGRWVRDDRVTVDHVHHASFGPNIKGTEPNQRNMRRWDEKYPGVNGWGQGQPWEENLFPAKSKNQAG